MCPRLPVDGKRVIEHRISFGTKERQLIEDLTTSARIASIDPEGMFKILEDPTRVIQIGYGIACLIEMFGFETGLPTPVDLVEWQEARKEQLKETKERIESEDRTLSSVAEDLLNMFTAGIFGVAYDELQRRVD